MVAIARPVRTRPSISLTPLIDVVFILLVFFMLASSFLEWRALEIQIPTFGSSASEAEGPLRVRIGRDGAVRIDDRAYEPETLDMRLRDLAAEDASRPVIVIAESGVPLQRTIAVIDRVGAHGLSNVSLSSEP